MRQTVLKRLMIVRERYPPPHDDKPQWENDIPLISLQAHHIHASLIRYVISL